MIGRTRSFCPYYSAAEFRWSGSGSNRRPAVVCRSKQLTIASCCLLVLSLFADRR